MSLLLILALAQDEDARRVPRNRLSIERCTAFDLSEEDFPKSTKKTALNTEIKVCDMNTRILNAVARFPGCSHDAYIWAASNLKKVFDYGGRIYGGEGWLLGDSGYPHEAHLHTPYGAGSDADDAAEYNVKHKRGRCVIERCNGILKNRFRCLLRHRTLHYMPEVACRIIYTCVILHNICVEAELTWEEIDLPPEDELFNTD